EQQILLAMKKRGFGEGKWNGVGGKVEEGESIEAAAVREACEEIGVVIRPTALHERGVLSFSFEDVPEFAQDVHVFFVTQWEGEPTESEEMRPQWYSVDALPYDTMWVSDTYWLPRVVRGENMIARFHFSVSGDEILDMHIEGA